ncbi:hypothetical protein QQF64_019110 [Cirrhinus molitorella]|uniref:Uncharacterized protein n=1 Tax=Cirrhinus molitorella TaxID=172907 RepID=A0ABR3LEJ4_9TELE
MYLLKVNGRPTGLSAPALSRANFLQSSSDCIKQHDNESGGKTPRAEKTRLEFDSIQKDLEDPDHRCQLEVPADADTPSVFVQNEILFGATRRFQRLDSGLPSGNGNKIYLGPSYLSASLICTVNLGLLSLRLNNRPPGLIDSRFSWQLPQAFFPARKETSAKNGDLLSSGSLRTVIYKLGRSPPALIPAYRRLQDLLLRARTSFACLESLCG